MNDNQTFSRDDHADIEPWFDDSAGELGQAPPCERPATGLCLIVAILIALWVAAIVQAICYWQDSHGGPAAPFTGRPMIQRPVPAAGEEVRHAA